MFIHLLPKNDKLLTVKNTEYAKRHYIKRFEKAYPGKRWLVTFDSIKEDISRIDLMDSDLQESRQVDELWYRDNKWIFKYDFRIAQTKQSSQGSGDRCICYLDYDNGAVNILLLYGKTDLPKNTKEQAYITSILKTEYPGIMTNLLSQTS